MTNNYILNIFNNQKNFFESNATLNIKNRKLILKQLKIALKKNYKEITAALKKDLNKSEQEVFITEYVIVMNEIKYMIKKLSSFSHKKKVSKSMTTMFSKSYTIAKPKGVCLISVPWNYPFQLALVPLIDAIASGNTAIVFLPHQTQFINKTITNILGSVFKDEHVICINKDLVPYENLFDVKYDFVFFTGSYNVGKIIAQQCANTLTPYTLELGGKNPTIITKDANLNLAAKRIARAKWFNAGQTCVAPDFVVIESSVYEQFIGLMKIYIDKFYAKLLGSDKYPKIISEEHFNRISGYFDDKNIIYGGKIDRNTLTIAPTMISAEFNSSCMKEEIFGPILPIIQIEDLVTLKDSLKPFNESLALYIFCKSKEHIANITNNFSSGAVCINDALMHISNHHLPFGGVGKSGIGSYHGKTGFNTFSNTVSYLKTSTTFDSCLFYPPWSKIKTAIIKMFTK